MCSEAINLANSCYIDNLGKVFDLLTIIFAMGGFIGSMVGIIKLITKKS